MQHFVSGQYCYPLDNDNPNILSVVRVRVRLWVWASVRGKSKDYGWQEDGYRLE